MRTSELKSIFPISKLRYLWTMLTGRHFVVMKISKGEEEVEFNEALLTLSNKCIIITDINDQKRQTTRKPFVIKKIQNKKKANREILQMKNYSEQFYFEDENGKECSFSRMFPQMSLRCSFLDICIDDEEYLFTLRD